MTTSPERGVEETHNTREWIEEIEHQAKQHIASLLGYLQQIHDSGQYRCAEIELEKVLENVELLTKTHHQELQKAREEEKSRILKLALTMGDCPINNPEAGAGWMKFQHDFCLKLTKDNKETILSENDQSELDQPINSIFKE